MRRLKAWWRQGVPPAICEEFEHWLRVVLTVGAALLVYAALKAQLARAVEIPSPVVRCTMAAAAPSTPLHEDNVHAVLAPGMPPRRAS